MVASSGDWPEIIRPYSKEEQCIIEDMGGIPHRRMVRVILTSAFDQQRYAEATREHPGLSRHFTRLQRIGGEALNAWASHFEEYYNVDIQMAYTDAARILHGVGYGRVVGYSGTEGPADQRFIVHGDTSAVHDIPA